MIIELAIQVTADAAGWDHVYGDGHPATAPHVRQAVEDGLMAGETPFYLARVEDDRVIVGVALDGWAFVVPDAPLTDDAVEAYVREALLADGTLTITG